MTKFSLWTERVSVSLPGSMPKFPARRLALFLPERYSAPRRARHCIVLSALPRAQVCLSNGAQLRTPRSRALCQNSRHAALPCSYSGVISKFPARSPAPFLPGRYVEAPGERGIALFSQPFPVPRFAFQAGRNCLSPFPGAMPRFVLQRGYGVGWRCLPPARGAAGYMSDAALPTARSALGSAPGFWGPWGHWGSKKRPRAQAAVAGRAGRHGGVTPGSARTRLRT